MIADRKVFIKVPKRSQAQVCKTEKSLSNWVGAVDVIHKLNLSSQAHELPVNTFLQLYPSLERSISKETWKPLTLEGNASDFSCSILIEIQPEKTVE